MATAMADATRPVLLTSRFFWLLAKIYPPPSVVGREGSIADRIDRVETRLRELHSELRNAGTPELRKELNKKIRFRAEQLRRLKVQLAVRERARNLDRSKFDAAKMEEFQRKFAGYTRQHTDWGYGIRDIEFTDKVIEELKSGTVDPNIEVVDSTYPKYSGPLLKCLAGGRIHQAAAIARQLIALGADTSCLDIGKSRFDEMWAVAITQGGFDALTGCLLPYMKQHPIPEKIVEDILYLNHRVDERDDSGNTALHYAARSGTPHLVSLLLLAEADVDAHNNRGETPLFEATKNDRKAICDLLIRAGADRKFWDNDGKTADNMTVIGRFRSAVTGGKSKEVAELLKKGVDPNTRFGDGYTALQTACRQKDPALVKALLDGGADPDLGCDSGGWAYYPLQLSLQHNSLSPEIFAMLLKKGANPNIHPLGYGYKTLLWDLCDGNCTRGEKADEAFLDALLDCSRTELYLDYYGSRISVLTMALRHKRQLRFVEKLVAKLKPFEATDPVVAAAVESRYPEELLRKLIAVGADVNAVCKKYRSVTQEGRRRSIEYTTNALFIAVENKRADIVRLLLRHGADKDWKNSEGKTVRDLDTSAEIRALLK